MRAFIYVVGAHGYDKARLKFDKYYKYKPIWKRLIKASLWPMLVPVWIAGCFRHAPPRPEPKWYDRRN